MRLIDADALEEVLEMITSADIKNIDGQAYVLVRLSQVLNVIKNAPTIEPEPHWTPVSERLPEDNMWTICQNNAGAMMIGKYNIEFGWMFPAYFDGIVAWMPRPESYREEGEN